MYESPFWTGWAADTWGVSWGYDANDKPIEVESGRLVPAGHWKHLFRALRAADAHEVRAKGTVRWVIERPEAFDLRQEAFATAVRATYVVRTSVQNPYTGVESVVVRVRAVCAAHRGTPKCAASPSRARHQSYSRANYVVAGAGCGASHVRAKRKVYYTIWTPETVQNPTDEMLFLLAA